VAAESAIRVIFCADPFNARQADPAYRAVTEAAQALGLESYRISYEALIDEHDAARAVRRVPQASEPALALYRGWMLRRERYGELFRALADRGLTLLNDPAAYALCHELPGWYPFLEAWTPRSAWIETDGAIADEQLHELLDPFGNQPVIVKDFVKSRKHEWAEACYIPDASDHVTAAQVARRFLELQGPDLNGGLVVRAFEPFEPLATHSRSGMPLIREYRLFCLDGEPIVVADYWEEGDYAGASPPIDVLRGIARLW
jgi:hypothetical protein